jgi:hypothetical protein
VCHQPARAVSIFENCFGVETHGRKCFGIPVSVLGRGYAPLYGAALCGVGLMGYRWGSACAARVAARRACADEYLKRWKVKFHKGKFLIGNI